MLNLLEESNWELSPERTRFQREEQPVSLEFMRVIPEEDKWSTVVQTHTTFLQAAIICEADPKESRNLVNLSVSVPQKASVTSLGKKSLQMKAVIKYSNNLKKVKTILAHVLNSQKEGESNAIKQGPSESSLT